MTPRFSVITVVLNDKNGFCRTRDSLGTQMSTLFEWVVIDGGSTDGTLDEITHSAVQCVWSSGKDNGIYDAMNRGIRAAQGDYLLFLNAGDELLGPDVLATIAKVIDESGSPGVVFAGARYSFGQEIETVRLPREMHSCIWHAAPANHQATFYKREVAKELMYDTTFRIAADYHMAARIYKLGTVAAYFNDCVVRFRAGDTSTKHPLLLFREAVRVQREVLHLSPYRLFLSGARKVLALSAFSALYAVGRVQAVMRASMRSASSGAVG